MVKKGRVSGKEPRTGGYRTKIVPPMITAAEDYGRWPGGQVTPLYGYSPCAAKMAGKDTRPTDTGLREDTN